MNKYIFIFYLCFLASGLFAQKQLEVTSPDGGIKATIRLADKIYYDIAYNGDVLLKDNSLQLDLQDGSLGQNPVLTRQKLTQVNETLTPVVPLKFSTVQNEYANLLMTFKGGYSVEFRAYNDGIAYRFITNKKGDVEVLQEEFTLNFPDSYLLHLQQPGSFKTAYEELYTHVESNEWKPTDKMSVLPVLVDTRKQYKILISESDLSDYPCMFLQGNGSNGVTAVFPKYPLEFGEDGDRSLKILKEAGYIAKTNGQRSFP